MNRKILLIVAVVVAALAAWAAGQILHGGLSARATPTRLETAIARRVRHLAIPSGARSMQNPFPASAEAIREGMLHFADHCALCHGNDGRGDTPHGRGLFPKPPDMRLPRTQNLSDGELFWIIENGVRFTGMPGFGEPGHQDESWKLVRFIRHLPQLTPEQRLEMERNNPKSLEDRAEEREEEKFLRGETPAPKPESKKQDHPH
jgi:mono/diheme cytochrome c family protein